MEFISDCRKAGIAPILGTELTLTGGHSIVLLAQNMRGYANLCCLITRLQAAPDREASPARGLSLADLSQHTEGLIALSGGRSGPLDASLRERDAPRTEHIARELVSLFGRDRFLVELQIIQEGDSDKAGTLQSLADSSFHSAGFNFRRWICHRGARRATSCGRVPWQAQRNGTASGRRLSRHACAKQWT